MVPVGMQPPDAQREPAGHQVPKSQSDGAWHQFRIPLEEPEQYAVPSQPGGSS
jgi:hypothetical protein